MTRLLRVAAVVVLVGGSAAVLSSCTGSTPEADPSPTAVVTSSSPEPSATVSPTPTALPPLTDEEVLALIPADAQVESFPGAVNFAAFFVTEYQRMFDNEDSRLFEAMSGPDCMFCSSSLEDFVEHVETGSSVDGGEITPETATAIGGLQEDGTWFVQFPVHIAAADYFNADGSLRTHNDSIDIDFAFSLSTDSGRWRVLGANYEPVGVN